MFKWEHPLHSRREIPSRARQIPASYYGPSHDKEGQILDFQKITPRKRKGAGRPRPGECLSGSPLYTPAGRSRLDPGKSQHLILGPPMIKRGHFWIFKKSLLANGRAEAGLDRVNVQVGAPSTLPQGDPVSSQENPSILLWGLPS